MPVISFMSAKVSDGSVRMAFNIFVYQLTMSKIQKRL